MQTLELLFMPSLSGKGKLVEITWEATVIREDGTKEELGVVSYWHKNPLRRLVYWIRGNLRSKRRR